MTALEKLVLNRLLSALHPSIRSLLSGCTFNLHDGILHIECPDRNAFDLAISLRTPLAKTADRFGITALECSYQEQRVSVPVELVCWMKQRSLLVGGNTTEWITFDS